MSTARLLPQRIDQVQRIIQHISVKVEAALVANRVGLGENAEVRNVGARLVVVETRLAQPSLAGVLEPAGVGGLRFAVFVVAVEVEQRAAAVGQRDNAAALV
jgi:hypothetical protein